MSRAPDHNGGVDREGRTVTRLRKRRGFTLVELLVVAVVLAIFAAVVVPEFAGVTDESKVAALKSDLAVLRKAIDLYYQQHGHYPGGAPSYPERCNGIPAGSFATREEQNFNFQLTLFSSPAGEVCFRKTGSYTLGPYINTTLIPQNPVTGSRVVRVTTLGTLQPSTGSDNGGWLFDSISGRLIADHADYEDL